MTNVKTISDFIDSIAPYSTKCEWDNCGILIGSPNSEVKKVGFTLDLTSETLNFASENNIDLVVTHHPVIFKPQKNFLDGNIAYDAACRHVNVISAHTCFDCANGGVNDVLCELLGISNPVGVESDECSVPMARMGEISETDPLNFAKHVASKLGTTVRFIGGKTSVKKVAVCGGAGMSFFNNILAAGAEAYVTGDISHHEMLEAKDSGITVIAAGHFETEYPAMSALKKMIEQEFTGLDCVLIPQNNPVEFVN
ncbi:MAG: Nif3-like dinuclear metal center hexameric protein [Faecalibacterium sp.]|nr:Nif3-like dinuclear metal center hexameric protein [Ruminococcus sp.]MCM1392345.1 Nif3-like dinuclear metal center hexameric protein [Ruminococcus sp.]MCM1484659.1 Nif3-like dinuclear metal center hexameric protein [Faecalibacterium sp.]